jgi:hypothetical protein
MHPSRRRGTLRRRGRGGGPCGGVRAGSLAGLGGALAATLALGQPAAAQTLRGRVMDEDTRVGIERVSIVSLNPAGDSAQAVLTDASGAFLLRLAEPGRHGLRVQREGYRGFVSEAVEVDADEEVALEVHLAADDVAETPVRVLARRRVTAVDDYGARIGFMRLVGMGRFLLDADIDSMRASAASEVLATVSGVSVTPSAEGPVIALMGNGAACTPALFVDGLSLRGVAVDRIVTPTVLEAVEVYQGEIEAPTEFADPRGCGVILLWTRRNTERSLPWRRAVVYIGMIAIGIVLFSR